ncbi:polysaccharide deacetylase family protein [Amycolatopsis thermophila]|uniref:Peptidoglycan/xylan/chitin deacetylase (PgdA/CDA1 family) n=1 Tax=Amycolatopsis thermophila TaxID=206084 RepID=A0ABU0F7F5_9PSEU|nr:polysaccharide deacetylase family protein [Amycolatopsis thermophila]MDQ0383046.1 peptidoglycan/xylan/chitin deacetylase (PgdA/CDA1 family) [Amycolatopsis thermophila]
MREPRNPMERRAFFGMLALGAATVITGCSSDTTTPTPASATPPAPPSGTDPDVPADTGTGGPTRVLSKGPAAGHQIALTVDDGYDNAVVAGYVAFAQRTGIHLTFSPNGLYAHAWAPHAATLKPLIEAGQVQIINHTYSHHDLRAMTDAQIRAELDRNDEWVSTTFGTRTTPYYRPPFGFHNAHVDGIAAELGYRNTVMWNGSYGDSKPVTPDYLMSQARRYLQPGTILLGHANHPTVLGLLDQIADLIRERHLTPVTLREMFPAADH